MKLNELQSFIDRADQVYYNAGSSESPGYSEVNLADDEYDSYKSLLREINPTDERLSRVGPPYSGNGAFTERHHQYLMGSLNNSNNETEFRKWHTKTNSSSLLGTLKIDGSSIAATYDGGKLQHVLTRGDGKTGQDITRNAIKFKGVPTSLPDPIDCVIRGEAVLKVQDWKRLDLEMQTNPRNYGNGIITRHDGLNCEYISFIAFDIFGIFGMEFETEESAIKYLLHLGLEVVQNRSCTTVDDAIDWYNQIHEDRKTLDYWIDGIVYRISHKAFQGSLGMSSNRPKGRIAFKFPSVNNITEVTGLTVTVGHTGAIIPTAQLRPVQIGGTTVSNALLNNYEEIGRLNVAVGDTVLVVKSGDIIPKIIKVIDRPEQRTEITEPATCPICHGSIGHRSNVGGDNTVAIYCLSSNCPAKSSQKVKRWIKSLDILGIGPAVLESLINEGLISNAADLYTLTTDIAKLNIGKSGTLGENRAQYILDEINKKRDLTIDQFIGSLGISYLGKRRVEIIRQQNSKFNDLSSWTDDISLVQESDNIGIPNIAETIQSEIRDAMPTIALLIANGVQIAATEPIEPESNIAMPDERFKFVLTGKMSQERNIIKEQIEQNGHEVASAMSSNVDYLVAADPDSGSSKMKKAAKLGITVISEDELQQLLSTKV